MPVTPEELESLLSNTEALINQVHWFEQTVQKPRAASHKGISINYMDIVERRSQFISELKSTMLNWVYSKQKYNEVFSELLAKRNNDVQNTNAYLYDLAKKKFRKGFIQGQFGELLLFNFLQFFFSAPPLLRKMPITTSAGTERNGADAIHYLSDGSNDVFILGESKCYSKKYKFNAALQESVNSIFTTFQNIEDELSLYVYDDFVDPSLEGIAKEFHEGKCTSARFELVCLVTYNETRNITGDCEVKVKKNIQDCLLYRWKNSKDTLYESIDTSLINRIHYVVFPIWNLDELLANFEE